MINDTTVSLGSRSSPTSTPASRDLGGMRTCKQISRDLVERRNLYLDIMCRLIIDQAQPPGDEGQRRTLQAGEHDDEDEHDIEEELCARNLLEPAESWPER